MCFIAGQLNYEKQIVCSVDAGILLHPRPSTLNSFRPRHGVPYQGRLNDNGSAANGIYDLRFTIYDDLAVGSVAGGPLTNATTAVSNGLFTVTLDFGAGVFTGADRWLDIGVRTNGAPGVYQVLTPRQPLSATPYAVRAANFSGAVSDSQLSGNIPLLSAGKLPDASLSTNIARLNASQTFTGVNTFSNSVRIAGNNTLEFGAGVTKESNAGKIGYQTFTADSLDIVGAGTNVSSRKIKFFAEGGSVFNGNVAAPTFTGDGSGLTPSTNVALRSGGNTFSGNQVITNGNVGIGTTSPSAMLDVHGDRSAVKIRANSAGQAAFIELNDSATNNLRVLIGADGTGFSGTANQFSIATWSSHPIKFFTVQTERMMIDTNGNVGIGTATPATALQVNGTVTADSFIATAAGSPANVIPVLGMVWIQPGTFIMGSRPDEPGRAANEGPQMVVTLTKGFWMGVHEVTQGEYLTVIGSNPSAFAGDLNRPVEQVNWDNANNYCQVLTISERAAGRLPAGWGYRLPTKAEWEYACRAGPRTTRFGYGDDLSYAALGNYAWDANNSFSTTHPVEQKLANPWGLMDMHGNVLEWCQDWYGTYPGGSVTDPQGPSSGEIRVLRSGSWASPVANCRSAWRTAANPNGNISSFGFRVVLSSGQP
jgi:formylglycine-generating enzyme required for sulfatase activity